MYVYILRSVVNDQRRYVGVTKNLKQRLLEHNQGKSAYTRKFMPWEVMVAIWIREVDKAFKFEKYLKTGSGYAFSKKHF